MRKLGKNFLQIACNTLELKTPVYEFGALQVEGQEGFSDLRPIVAKRFPDHEYVGCDMREGLGVDHVLDLHDLDLSDEEVGAVVTLDTLEHVEFPRKALSEIYRVLAPGGVLIMSSVMYFPIHAFPDDYWRFTPSGFRSLLETAGFSQSLVSFAGPQLTPHTVVGVGIKAPDQDVGPLTNALEVWQDAWLVPA